MMPSDTVVLIANFLQSCIPLLSLVAYIPQWKKLLKNKSSKDMSISAWLIWCLPAAIAVFYAVVQYQVNQQGAALVFSSAFNLLFVFVTLALIWVYRDRTHKNI